MWLGSPHRAGAGKHRLGLVERATDAVAKDLGQESLATELRPHVRRASNLDLATSPSSSIARRIRVISARTWGSHCCTDGCRTDGRCTYRDARTHIDPTIDSTTIDASTIDASTIDASTINAAMIRAHADAARAIASSIRQSLGGYAREAKDARHGNTSDGSILHGLSFLEVTSPACSEAHD